MGLRPVVEMQFMDFISPAYDVITNYLATSRYRGSGSVPVVVRGPVGGGNRGGPFHSQNVEMAFFHTPGLKIVYPSTAYDAKGLMKAAIRDDDPVIFEEHKSLYRAPHLREVLPAEDYVVLLGKARSRARGRGRDHRHLWRDGARQPGSGRGAGEGRRGRRSRCWTCAPCFPWTTRRSPRA